jgi:N-acetylglucosaminyldiphosphoundecaprenol N-acetyl-beta-D-mannosaminyltransferase
MDNVHEKDGAKRWIASERMTVGSVPFMITSRTEAVDGLISGIKTGEFNGRPATIRLANAFCVGLAETNPEYSNLLSSGGFNLPDGAPVAAFMRWSKSDTLPTPERVRGPSFFRDVLDRGRDGGVRHMFIGGDDPTLESLLEQVEKQYPGVSVVGSWSPPFKELDEGFFIDAALKIQSCNPDIVWIGMGTPKQDFAATRLANDTKTVTIGVGAAFDFVAGSVDEAPAILQAIYLEWLYRLVKEPRRLWKRYLIGNWVFLRACIKTAIANRGNNKI